MTIETAHPNVINESGKSQGDGNGWVNVQYYRGDGEEYASNTLVEHVDIYEWIDGVRTRVGP